MTTAICTIAPPQSGPCAGLCAEAGLAAVHREYHGLLLRRARYLLGDAGLADDAVQEVFVRAWRACPTLDPAVAPLRNWLLTVLRNIVIDQARARARRPRLVEPAPAEIPTDTHDAITALLQRTALVDALGRISTEHRDAVVATVVRDRSYPQAAAELRIPVGTVKSRVFYGLRQLREILSQPAAA